MKGAAISQILVKYCWGRQKGKSRERIAQLIVVAMEMSTFENNKQENN